MRYLVSIAIPFFAMLPTVASANCAGRNCNDVLLERVVVFGLGSVAVRTSGDETQLDCDPGSSNYLQFDTTAPAYSEWYAMVLTAYVQQAPISFRLNIGSGPCTVQYMFQDQ